MIKNNNRNSRDDKSKAGEGSKSRRTTGTDQSKGRSSEKDGKYSDKDDKEKRKPGFATGDKPAYKPRTSRDGDSKPYTPRPTAGKDFKPRSNRDGDSKPYTPRTSAGKDFKPRTDRDSTSSTYKPRNTSSDGGFKSRDQQDEPRAYKPKTDQKGGFKPWEKKESGNSDYKPKAYKEGSSRDDSAEKRSYVKKDNYIVDGDKSKFADKKSSTSRSTDSRVDGDNK